MSEPDFYYEYHIGEKGKRHKIKKPNTHKDNIVLGQTIEQGQSREVRIENTKSQAGGLLAASDWTQIPDNGLSEEKRNEWKAYRAAVRHIRANAESLYDSVQWPEPPAK